MTNDDGITNALELRSNKSSNELEPAYYGACSQCSCPGFQGSGYSCERGGCGHHYDSHGS